MAEFPALPLFTDAYLADTHPDLSLEEHGCYLLLMQAAWRRPNCDLPDDDKWFCKWLGIHGNKWRTLRVSVLERFWILDRTSCTWSQKRLRKERDFVEKRARFCSEMGKKSVEVRRKNKELASASVQTPTPTPTLLKKDSPSESPKKADARPAVSPAKGTQGTRLTRDWKPSEADRQYAEKVGFEPTDTERIAQDFRDYWTAKTGQGATKLDWQATWRTWIRRETDRRTERRERSNYVAPHAQLVTEYLHRMADLPDERDTAPPRGDQGEPVGAVVPLFRCFGG